jgi:hypothetical protein
MTSILLATPAFEFGMGAREEGGSSVLHLDLLHGALRRPCLGVRSLHPGEGLEGREDLVELEAWDLDRPQAPFPSLRLVHRPLAMHRVGMEGPSSGLLLDPSAFRLEVHKAWRVLGRGEGLVLRGGQGESAVEVCPSAFSLTSEGDMEILGRPGQSPFRLDFREIG